MAISHRLSRSLLIGALLVGLILGLLGPHVLDVGAAPEAGQAPVDTPTSTETATSTSTATSTGTNTATPTSTGTPTPTPRAGVGAYLDVMINEVGWAGTGISSTTRDDQWIELYNTRSFAISLDNWELVADGVTIVSFGAGDVIPAGGFFLLVRPYTGDCSGADWQNVFTDNVAIEDKCFSTKLTNTSTNGNILELHDPVETNIDTANSDGGSWPAGLLGNAASMERRAMVGDFGGWVTFAGTTANKFALNRASVLVNGTPKRPNWFTTITPTVTRTRTKKPTGLPPTPFGRPIISEFLPRPGFDWNQDGKIDVFDEFIEITNIGPVPISMNGWILDDEPRLDANGVDTSSPPFTIPSLTLEPGQRVVFYGSQTNLLLSDGGDAVRLFNSSGVIYDTYTYPIAKVRDQSWCRIPEGRDWHEDCVPTPGLPNTRQGQVPSMPSGNGPQPPVCTLPDTIPADIISAECFGYGTDMWSSMYWDRKAWQGDRYIPDAESKWLSFIE